MEAGDDEGGGIVGGLEGGAAAAAAGAQGRPLRALAAELLERATTAEEADDDANASSAEPRAIAGLPTEWRAFDSLSE